MKRSLIFLFVLITIYLGTFRAYSQEEDYSKPPEKTKNFSSLNLKNRLLFGGGAAAQFGDVMNISLMPKVGYLISERFVTGIGITYVYYKINYDRMYGYGGIFETNVYGGSLFGDYFILENLFAHFEPEFLNYEYYVDPNSNNTARTWITSYFIGGGYRQKISNKGYIQLMLLYNLNYKDNSPYNSPWEPRISIMF